MKPSIASLLFLFPCASAMWRIHLAQLAGKCQWMVLIQQHLYTGLSAPQMEDTRHRFTRRWPTKPKLSPSLTSSAWYQELGCFYLSAVSCPQFNILHARHEKTSFVTAEEHKAQHELHALASSFMWSSACLEEGKREGTRQKRTMMTSMSSDTKMRAVRLGSQILIRTQNRIHALWTRKALRKYKIIKLPELAVKKNIQNLVTTFTQNTQTTKRHFSQKHTHFNKPKAMAIKKTSRETGESQPASPKRHSLQEGVCTVQCYLMIPVIFTTFLWLQKLVAGQGSCTTELL